jgi:hypothetical protein
MYGKRFERELGVDDVADQLIAVFELTRLHLQQIVCQRE